MPKILCYVGNLKVNPEFPVVDNLKLGNRSIPDYFRDASLLTGGTPAIDLVMKQSLQDSLHKQPGLGVNALQLQEALTELIHNPTESVPDGARCVALILADRYEANPNAYGFMFDKPPMPLPFSVGDMEPDVTTERSKPSA